MKRLLLAVLLCAFSGTLFAQSPFTFYVHDPTGVALDTPFPSTYSFPTTPQNGYSDVTVEAVNTSTTTLLFGTVLASTTTGGITPNTNFTLTHIFLDRVLAPGASTTFTLAFAPLSTGAMTAYLQVVYQVQSGTCSFTSNDSGSQCTGGITTVSTLSATASSPQFSLLYASSTGGAPVDAGVVVQPGSETPVGFGNVSTSKQSTITFSLVNNSSVTSATPVVDLKEQINVSSPFALDISMLPSTIAAGASATFTATFGPGEVGLFTGLLEVGGSPFQIQGIGVIVADIDALQISYVTPALVHVIPQSATPIDFGQVVSGGGSVAFAFTCTNPSASFNSIDIPSLAVTGTGFALSLGPTIPTSLDPGQSITFTVTFTPSGVASYSGNLSIGARSFSLEGVSASAALPAFAIALATPLSRQNLNLTITAASASPTSAIGTLVMQFIPSVGGVSDDPQVQFTGPGSRSITVTLASGATQVLYSGSASIALYTGDTAGTIRFTLTFPTQIPTVKSFTVAKVKPSNLTINSISKTTISGTETDIHASIGVTDNAYTLTQVTFTVLTSSGGIASLSGNPENFDVTTAEHNYYFSGSDITGGHSTITITIPLLFSGGTTYSSLVSAGDTVSFTFTNSLGNTAVGNALP